MDETILLDLIEQSNVEVHLMDKGYIVGIGKLTFLEGQMEWNGWRILKNKQDSKKLWVSYPSYKNDDSGKVIYFTDQTLKDVIDAKIMAEYEKAVLMREGSELAF